MPLARPLAAAEPEPLALPEPLAEPVAPALAEPVADADPLAEAVADPVADAELVALPEVVTPPERPKENEGFSTSIFAFGQRQPRGMNRPGSENRHLVPHGWYWMTSSPR